MDFDIEDITRRNSVKLPDQNGKTNLHNKMERNNSKSSDYMSLFKRQGVCYQPFPTIEDIFNRNNNLLYSNKNTENMKKVIKMRMYDNDVQTLAKISKILDKPLNRMNSKQMNSSKKKSVEKKKQNLKKKSNYQEVDSKQFFLTSSLNENKLTMLKRSTSPIIENINNVIPPIIINRNKPYEDNEDNNMIEDSTNYNKINKHKLKFLEIYKSSPEKEEYTKTLKKSKNISLQKYQENLINAVADEIQPKDLVDLIRKFNDIRILSETNNVDYLKNIKFYNQLVNMVREDMNYYDNYDDQSLRKSDRRNYEVKFKYRKKAKPDKHIEKLKNIVPKYLYDKLNKNNI